MGTQKEISKLLAFHSAVPDMDPTCLPGHGRLGGMNLHGGLHSGNGMVPPYQTLGGGLVMPERGGVMVSSGMMPGARVVGANPTNHLGNASTRERGARSYLRKQNTVQCTRYILLHIDNKVYVNFNIFPLLRKTKLSISCLSNHCPLKSVLFDGHLPSENDYRFMSAEHCLW